MAADGTVRGLVQRFAKCPFTCQFDWLFDHLCQSLHRLSNQLCQSFDRLSDQLCQSLDRLSDHFAKHWSSRSARSPSPAARRACARAQGLWIEGVKYYARGWRPLGSLGHPLSALRSARLPVNVIGSPINYANRLIGSPITSLSTALGCRAETDSTGSVSFTELKNGACEAPDAFNLFELWAPIALKP